MVDSKISRIISYINENINIGDKCNDIIEECINLIHQGLPVDNAGVFSKLSHCNSASDDLAYVIMSVRKVRSDIEKELRKLKDPKFTILVRSGRPSSQAIESEIRFTIPEVANLEDKLSTFDNILDYLNHIEKCLDRNIWILRDLAQYIKK